MTCQELVELVTDYLEGVMPAGDRARFEEHLAICPGCQTYLDQMRQTMRLVGDTEQLEQRPEVAALMAAFRDFHRDP